MVEGIVGEWYVKEGDYIVKDVDLVNIENDKFLEDFLLLVDGMIMKILV